MSDDHPRKTSHKALWAIGAVMLVLALVADLIVHSHAHFGMDGWFGFQAWYAFLACLVLVLGARGLAAIVTRREDPYDE